MRVVDFLGTFRKSISYDHKQLYHQIISTILELEHVNIERLMYSISIRLF